MQTFLPYENFKESAKCLDNRRLGKQRVECLQILKCLATGPEQLSLNQSSKSFKYSDGMFRRKTPWYNHPAAKMWKGYESYLSIYGRVICKEWIERGFKDTCYEKIYNYYDVFPISKDRPEWLGNSDFHTSHMSNLIRKNPLYYRPIFGNDIPDNLPYIWPAK